MKHLLILTICFLFSFSQQVQAQNIVKLKAQRIEGEGANEKLSSIIFQYELVDNQKLFFIKNGKRQKGHFDLQLDKYDENPNGILLLKYKILNKGIAFDKIAIIDIRKLSVTERKKTFHAEYPMLLLMEDEDDNNNTLLMAAELLSGQFKNTTLATLPDLPAKENSNTIKLESVNDNPLYKINIENKSIFTVSIENGESETLKVKLYGEEYKNGMQLYSFAILDDPRYKTLGIVDLTELSPSERVDALGITSPVLISMDGGTGNTITIPAKFVSGRLPKIKNNEMIHQELTSLFESMENGFSDQIKKEMKKELEGEIKEQFKGFATGFYESNMELGYLKHRVITKFEGTVYYEATIFSFMESQVTQILQALESYPSSGNYKISRINSDDFDVNYVVKKSNKTKGFIRFFKNKLSGKEEWSFQLFKTINNNELKSSLLTGINQIVNNPDAIKGAKEDDNLYTAKKRLPGSYRSNYITSGEKASEWKSVFTSYPFEALKYQLKEIDIAIKGRSKTIDEKKGLYVLIFENDSSKILVYTILNKKKPVPLMGVSYIQK